jgi:hypothetical protein
MTVNDTSNRRFRKLVTLLKELLQFDQPDPDFGFYRVMPLPT